MRVLHIIGTLNPESGGPASSTATLIEFSPAGSYNEVLTLDDPQAAFLRNVNFPVVALGPVHTKYGFTTRLIPWLKVNSDRFDAIVIHGLWQFCGFAAWRALRSRKPYLVFVHGMLDPYFKRAFPLKHLKKWLYWLLAEYWVLRSAHRVLFTCAAEERLAHQSFWLNDWTSHVVPYGASVPAGNDQQRLSLFYTRFPQLHSRRYLLFLGRIDRKKGCDLLIKAFVLSAALDPELDLVMAGPDERQWRPELERLLDAANLKARVHWTGMLKGDEKWGAFLGAEAFILPSHQENFGIAVAEAMALRKPVLLSDKVNIAADIAAADAGLMQPDTLAGTRLLIENWIAMPLGARKMMADKAHIYFQLHYDMRTNTRDISDALDIAATADFEPREPSVLSAK